MSILARALRFLGTVWLWAAGLLIVFSHIVVLQLDGLWALINLLNPWNIASMLTLDLTMAPGLLLHMAADQLTISPASSEDRSAIIPSHPVALVQGLRTEQPAML
jgi:hypothetical protein